LSRSRFCASATLVSGTAVSASTAIHPQNKRALIRSRLAARVTRAYVYALATIRQRSHANSLLMSVIYYHRGRSYLSCLPSSFPSPERAAHRLPAIDGSHRGCVTEKRADAANCPSRGLIFRAPDGAGPLGDLLNVNGSRERHDRSVDRWRR